MGSLMGTWIGSSTGRSSRTLMNMEMGEKTQALEKGWGWGEIVMEDWKAVLLIKADTDLEIIKQPRNLVIKDYGSICGDARDLLYSIIHVYWLRYKQ